MSNYTLTCCSTADMPRAFFEQRDIPFVCFQFIMDGVTYKDDLGLSMSPAEFYQRITDGAMPTTSQVNVEQYTEFFEPFLAAGKDVLHLALSSGISGSCNSARIAREELMEKYPDRKLYIVDTIAASSGFGLLVDAMADRRDSGEDIDASCAWANEQKEYLHHWFFSTDLTCFYRGGRISRASATFGTILNICPLMNIDLAGRLIPREKIRGKKAVIETIVKRMEQHAKDGLDYSGKCFISCSACEDDARAVADLIEARFKNLDGKVMINNIGTVIGAHTGPGTVALFYWGDRREEPAE